MNSEATFGGADIRRTNRDSMEAEIYWATAQNAPMATPMPVAAPAMDMPVGEGFMYGSVAPGNVGWEDVAGQNERHLIQRANMDLESDHFNDTVSALRQFAPSVEGYIESEMLTTQGWPRFTIVLRVPSNRFEEVLRHIESLAVVRNQNQWADDVTDQFYNLAGNLETRRIEEDRILALIDRATEIHELLALESRLSNVRHAIESYLSQLNQMAGQIAYSTISVTLTCTAIPPVAATSTLGERIGGAFGDSVDGTVRALQGFIVFLAGAVIPLVLIGLVGTALFLIGKNIRRKIIAARSV